MARNPLFKVKAFAPDSAWRLALLAPDAPEGKPRVAVLAGQKGKLLANETDANPWKAPYAAWLHSPRGHFIGGWRRDEEMLEYGEVVRRRANESANGPNAIRVATMAYARNLAPGASPPNFAEEWGRLAGRAATAADGFAPMVYGATDFPTVTTDYASDRLGTSIGLSANVTLKGERMAAFSYKDAFGNEENVPGDAFIEGAVSANDDTTQHAEAASPDFPLRPPFLLFPNVSAGARLRLHFQWEAQLSASVATGKGAWRPAHLTVSNPAFALYAPPKAFVNSDTLFEGNYGPAGSLTVPLALTPKEEDDGNGYAYAEGKLTLDVTVPPAKLLLFAWADGLVKTLVEALAADATAYTGHPDDGAQERLHREHLHAKLDFTLALTPFLTEEPLDP